MNPIGLVQRGRSCHTVQKERNEDQVILLCQSGIHRFEAIRVLRTIIRRQFYAGKDDRDRRASTLLNDPFKVGLRLPETEPAKSIVATELENNDLRPAL